MYARAHSHALIQAETDREDGRERRTDTECRGVVQRDRRAYTAIERGDSYGGGRAIELKTEAVSRGRKKKRSHWWLVEIGGVSLIVSPLVTNRRTVVDETVNEGPRRRRFSANFSCTTRRHDANSYMGTIGASTNPDEQGRIKDLS